MNKIFIITSICITPFSSNAMDFTQNWQSILTTTGKQKSAEKITPTTAARELQMRGFIAMFKEFFNTAGDPQYKKINRKRLEVLLAACGDDSFMSEEGIQNTIIQQVRPFHCAFAHANLELAKEWAALCYATTYKTKRGSNCYPIYSFLCNYWLLRARKVDGEFLDLIMNESRKHAFNPFKQEIRRGKKILHLAALRNPTCLALLLTKSTPEERNLRDENGRTCLDLALGAFILRANKHKKTKEDKKQLRKLACSIARLNSYYVPTTLSFSAYPKARKLLDQMTRTLKSK